MHRIFDIVACLYLGGMALWYLDRVFNNGIPNPHGDFLFMHEALLTWMVIVLWSERRRS